LMIGFLAEQLSEPSAVIICSGITMLFSVLIAMMIRKINSQAAGKT